MKLGAYIVKNLFGEPEELTKAHVIYFKIFELFMVYEVIWHSWYWGIYTLKIRDVVLPLGLARLVDISFMHNEFMPIIVASLTTIIVLVAFFRIGSKWLYAIALLLFHILYVARFSIGEIPHSANLVGMALFSFAIGLGFFDKKNERYRFIIGITIFYIGAGYFSASISKLIGTGITWVDGRHLWLWIAEKGTDILSREGEFQYTFVQTLALNSIPIATMILIVGILTEFFGILFWFNKARPFIALFLIGMHFGVTLSMNIRFDAFMIELFILGFPWPEWYNRYQHKIRGFFEPDKIPI
ncbi:MAG: hypothetical protein ED557_01970 [Balneola sp.]|nr:MAG: hypothetical protein ED557_01970 [Balneola sp.]